MVKKLWTSFVVSVLIAGAPGCTPSVPAPDATNDTQEMTEESAIERAKAEAQDAQFSLDGMDMQTRTEDGNWLVSFSPEGGGLGGGFVVELNKDTGEMIRAQFTQ